jgi:SAM-dependent methyltransferase
LRLNLGCGHNKLPGYVNVDKSPVCAPDAVVDLEVFPWPFPDGAAEEVVLRHVLEHLGAAPATYLRIVQELYRVCAPGARIVVTVPHPRHDDFLSDPTHVRAITPQGLELFSQAKNRQWAAEGRPNTPLGLQLGVDFEIVAANMRPDEPWRSELQAGRLSSQDLARAMRQFNNVIKEIEIVLRAVKPEAAR